MEKQKEKLVEKIKKSELTARDGFDYYKLSDAGDNFLLMEWEEEEEEISLIYDIDNKKSFSHILMEDKFFVYNILIAISLLEKDYMKYKFSIEPSNLYYNSIGRIYIKHRDIYRDAEARDDLGFLEDYKALCACALTGQYKYSDYREGGLALYSKSTITSEFSNMKSVTELVEYLTKYRDEQSRIRTKKYTLVNKYGYVCLKIALITLFVIVIGLGSYFIYDISNNEPYYKAVTRADNAYIENNMVGVIDALCDTEINDLDKHHKYILARAYIHSESLTLEQKENILSHITMLSSEKEFEYWIHVGKRECESAQNVAMQLSDDELLLYAYLLEKAQVENDVTLSGTEKSERISSLQSKIDSLAQKYEESTNEESNTDKTADSISEETAE